MGVHNNAQNVCKSRLERGVSLSVTTSGQEFRREVVVKAQKRTESCKTYRFRSLRSAVSRSRTRRLEALASWRYVPNFSVSENAVNTIITMRGISIVRTSL